MNLIQRIKDGASRVTEKAQSSVEIGKLNNRISEIEHDMEIEFMKMGKLFYEGYRTRDLSIAEGKMTEISRHCLKYQEEIDSLRMHIAELKNERLCPCGHIVPLDANFCPSCGRKMEDGAKDKAKEVARAKESTIPPTGAYVHWQEDQVETVVSSEEIPLYESDDEYSNDYEETLDEEETLPLPLEELSINTNHSLREQQHADDLERERERQLELDQRIRDWKAQEYVESGQEDADTKDLVKCQICRVDLPKGSMWCPRCGSEQI